MITPRLEDTLHSLCVAFSVCLGVVVVVVVVVTFLYCLLLYDG